jgi:acyl-activating enzyme 14
MGGISSALGMLMAGATHVFLPQWRVHEAITAVQKHHVSTFIAVPAMLNDIVQTCGGSTRNSNGLRTPFLGIRTLLVGGGSMGGMVGDVVRLFPNAVIATAYGEASAEIMLLCLAFMTPLRKLCRAPVFECGCSCNCLVSGENRITTI